MALILLVLALPALYCLWTHLVTALWGGRVEAMLSGPGLRALAREIRLQYLLVILAVGDHRVGSRQEAGVAGVPDRPVIVLLPGYTETPSLFRPLRRALTKAGCCCLDFAYDNMRGDPVRETARLREFLESLERQASGPVVLVGHSLGALLGAACRQTPSGRRLPLVALAAPWRGTRLARLSLASCGRHLSPGSAFMAKVIAPQGPDVLNIRTCHDNLLVPAGTSALENVEEMEVVDGWGHNGLLWDPPVIRKTVAWILDHG